MVTAKSTAFTLIELIFAIVIISIVFLALPSLSSSNSDALETSLNQEALFATASELSKVLTYRWDENSRIADPVTHILSNELVVDTTDDNDLSRVTGTPYRVGHINNGSDNHRKFHGAVTSTNAVVHDHDILSREVSNRELFTSTSETLGYKRNYRVDIDVEYSDDTPGSTYNFLAPASGSGLSNMKVIEAVVDIQQADTTWDDGAIVLRAYAANIGEVELLKW